MAKRGNGEGTICQRPDGRWTAALTLPDGSRKYYYGKRQADVLDQLDAARTARRSGKLRGRVKGEKLGPLLDAWLATRKTEIRPSTFTNYRTAITWLKRV